MEYPSEETVCALRPEWKKKRGGGGRDIKIREREFQEEEIAKPKFQRQE